MFYIIKIVFKVNRLTIVSASVIYFKKYNVLSKAKMKRQSAPRKNITLIVYTYTLLIKCIYKVMKIFTKTIVSLLSKRLFHTIIHQNKRKKC